MHVVSSWHRPTTPPPLPGPNIHLWWIDCTSPAGHGADDCLSADEHERAERMHEPSRFVCFRVALRTILGLYLEMEPAGLMLGYARHGKPYLMHPDTPLSFNLAHSGDHGLLALGEDVQLGVDLERVRPFPRALPIARRQLGNDVAAALARLPIPRMSQAFFEEWTLMEARAKAGGGGVFAPMEASYGGLGFVPRDGWRGALASSGPLPDPHDWRTFQYSQALSETELA